VFRFEIERVFPMRLIGQIRAQIEHVLNGEAECLAEKAKQRKIR